MKFLLKLTVGFLPRSYLSGKEKLLLICSPTAISIRIEYLDGSLELLQRVQIVTLKNQSYSGKKKKEWFLESLRFDEYLGGDKGFLGVQNYNWIKH
jgi:hypothetical protein